MNDLVRFASSVEFATGKKRGRHPVFSARMFYPYAAERRLQIALRNELEEYIGAAYEAAVFNESFSKDSLAELSLLQEGVSDDLKAEISYAAEQIARKVSSSIAEMTEMTVGKPYYPQAAKESLLKDWEANFQMLCVSAESDAKKDISRLVQQAKNEGWNGKQLEKAVKKDLPEKYANRASLIARTETAKLNTSVTLETYKEIGCQYYMWMATLDERVRPDHAMMNGLICSATDPEVWFEENPDDPMHPIEHKRDDTMVHLHPGDDFQCRCTMVMWDPVIDGKYEVKEAPEEEEPKEPEKGSNNEQLEETERQLRLMKAANKRHMERTPEQAEEIRQRWSERERRIRIRQAAEKRHAERNAEAIIKEFNRRIEIRNIAKETVNKASGINGIGIEKLEQTMNGGSKESYSEMKKQAKEVNKKIDELKAMKYVQNPIQVAKDFDYKTVVAIENSIKAKIDKWDKYGVSLAERKSKLEYEINYVENQKKYASWKVAQEAYKKLLSEVNKNLQIEKINSELIEIKSFSSSHKKFKNLKKWISELETMIKNQPGFTEEQLVAQMEKVVKEQNRIKSLEPKPVNVSTSSNGSTENTVTSKKYGVEKGVQKQEMPPMFKQEDKIEAIKELTLVNNAVAKDFNSAVNGFSYQWDYEIRAVQVGDKTLVSKHGHSLEQIKKKAIDLEEFIEKSPKWDGGTTYRGMGLSTKDLAEYKAKIANGDLIDMRGSASWSTNQLISQQFAESNIGKKNLSGDLKTEKVLFVNNNNQPLGTSICHLSNYYAEHEILVSKKARYKITGYQHDAKTGYHYFIVEPL